MPAPIRDPSLDRYPNGKPRYVKKSSRVNGATRLTVTGARRYASVLEAADYLGVNPATVRVMLADGRLTRYQLGERIVRVDLNEIDAKMKHGGAA